MEIANEFNKFDNSGTHIRSIGRTNVANVIRRVFARTAKGSAVRTVFFRYIFPVEHGWNTSIIERRWIELFSGGVDEVSFQVRCSVEAAHEGDSASLQNGYNFPEGMLSA